MARSGCTTSRPRSRSARRCRQCPTAPSRPCSPPTAGTCSRSRTPARRTAGTCSRRHGRSGRARSPAGHSRGRSGTMRCRGASTRPRAPADFPLSAASSDTARDQSAGSVFTALAANTTIAIAKGTAAALTGSPALFAETLHTIADAGNEVLLVIALRRSRREPDESHPFGYGPERYYWALLAAVGMFVIGGALSVWEGVRSLIDPLPLEAFW